MFFKTVFKSFLQATLIHWKWGRLNFFQVGTGKFFRKDTFMKKPCQENNCRNYADEGSKYCEVHQKTSYKVPLREEELKNLYNKNRWKIFSRKFLSENKTCIYCGKSATVCHHAKLTAVMMFELFNDFIYEETYYQGVCQSCNNGFLASQDRKRNYLFLQDRTII